jgi:hypothetical protein
MQRLIVYDNGRLRTAVMEEVMLQGEDGRESVEVFLTVDSNRCIAAAI